jgi:hypothetical protein
MPEDPNDSSLSKKVQVDASKKLARDLASTFDAIAKTAMRASAEFADLENDPGVYAKVQKAHSVVTLLMDDAMRGLNEAINAAMVFALAVGLEKRSGEEEE